MNVLITAAGLHWSNIHESMYGIVVSTPIHTLSRLCVKSDGFPQTIYFLITG